ncbi:MAG: SufS family cysteine desulfurase [Promicromonosporaceae bacterium]|nr:SufS family cysteine desulfurase [Promicromonosporaceae bacterium]
MPAQPLPLRVRGQFPILNRTVRGGKPLIYLDSAATTQRPLPVLRAMRKFSETYNAAVHRGAHQLAEEATEAFETARTQVAEFLNCAPDEVVWTSGATSALNLVATAMGHASNPAIGGPKRYRLGPGDEILVTEAEHHSNLVPWQQLALRTGARLRWFGVHDDGRIDLSNLNHLVNRNTKVVAVTHISNVTGAITPLDTILGAAHAVGATTVLDACQSAAHLPLDIPALGVDFAALSGHKVFGPTGVGVLYGRAAALADLPPASFGGSMVETVTMETATFRDPPARFEAGTQMVTQAIGLGVALEWLGNLGWPAIEKHERTMTAELLKIAEIPGIRIIGPTDLENRIALVSFTVDGVHPHDVGQVLDDSGIAVRVGQHCAQPIHDRFGIRASVRASASVYNTVEEIAKFREALTKVRPFFGLD